MKKIQVQMIYELAIWLLILLIASLCLNFFLFLQSVGIALKCDATGLYGQFVKVISQIIPAKISP